jgi:hypothetical protein
LAETARFELAVAITRHDGLANRWFQPLTHVSSAWQMQAIASKIGGINHQAETYFRQICAFWRDTDSIHRASIVGPFSKDSNAGSQGL